jgi:hypothetical protein
MYNNVYNVKRGTQCKKEDIQCKKETYKVKK